MSNKPKCVECGADTQVTETRPGDGAAIMQRRTRKACMREGFRFLGIEREAEYLAIARARIEHEARRHGALAAEPLPPETIAAAAAPPERHAPRPPKPEPAQRALF